jgi:hypothetical protein
VPEQVPDEAGDGEESGERQSGRDAGPLQQVDEVRPAASGPPPWTR